MFVGDAMEETPADLYAAARELGLPVFLFQEGDDSEATRVFREIARLTKGAHCRFDPGSGKTGRLLRAVATYAAGGRQALLASGNAGALKLLEQRSKRAFSSIARARYCGARGSVLRRDPRGLDKARAAPVLGGEQG